VRGLGRRFTKWEKDRPTTSTWKGHDTFLISVAADQKTVKGLGGYQGNLVKVSTYKMSDILSFSWPRCGQDHKMYAIRPGESGGEAPQSHWETLAEPPVSLLPFPSSGGLPEDVTTE
jgi:hypothetical protein